jgi:nitrate/nitrite-specific signal transduction histidine kinase
MAHKHNRKLINLLLQPLVQLRIGMVNAAISLLFVGGLGWYAWDRLHQITEVITTLTQADDEISKLISSYLANVAVVAGVTAGAFILISLAATVWMTHKLVGPTIAFRRHIAALLDGKFGTRLVLRKGDAFTEVADDLNRLSDFLTKYKSN